MFGPPLDSLTLLLSISALGFVMAAIAWSAGKAMPAFRPALRAWRNAMLAAGAGFFLFHMRGHAPWWSSFIAGNMLVVSVAAFALVAHGELLDWRAPRAVIASCWVGALAGVMSTYALGTPQVLAIAAVSTALAVLFATTGVLLACTARARLRLLGALSATVMLAMAAALVLRVFIALFGDPADVTPTATAKSQTVLFLLGIVYILTTSLWIFDTVHERQRQAGIEAARRDGLTGVYTRSAFFELATLVLGQQRTRSCAAVMLDIDHFKSINDAHGHAAGDTTLAHAARLIANTVRLSDVVGRYGGEEFCILLPDCDARQAAELAERFVADAARQGVRLKNGHTLHYTLSAGYAAVDGVAAGVAPDGALSALLERADQALYAAKRGGRNRALAAPPPDAVPHLVPAA